MPNSDEVKRLPHDVRLSGINYRIQESEGLITFTETDSIWGCAKRICFERDCDGLCWYVHLQSSSGKVMFAHIEQAMRLVESVYGRNFETKGKSK